MKKAANPGKEGGLFVLVVSSKPGNRVKQNRFSYAGTKALKIPDSSVK